MITMMAFNIRKKKKKKKTPTVSLLLHVYSQNINIPINTIYWYNQHSVQYYWLYVIKNGKKYELKCLQFVFDP